MILKARDLEAVDSCDRKYALLRDYEPTLMSPTAMLYAGIEAGLVGENPGESAKDAIRELSSRVDLDAKALSGLSGVRHVGLLAEVLSVALRRVIGKLNRVQPVEWMGHTWESGLFECHKTRTVHRIVLIPHYDDEILRSFAHQWGVVGELAALGRDIMLTAVVIGQSRGGRRHSHWTKGLTHPVQKSLRFARRDGEKSGFTKGWKDVWREQTQITAEAWLDQMTTDGVLEEMIVTRKVPHRRSDGRVVSAERDLVQVAERMAQASADSPMRRSACDDLRGACPFQAWCWSPEPVEMEELSHLFRRREEDDQMRREALA